ncbi:MAG: helix-turn-helix domain-containing protein [Pseudomonadota bacterium]
MDKRSFTSHKLEMLEALSCDPEVKDGVFRFAFRVMQHINAGSGLAWPSMDRIAQQMNVSVRTAQRHSEALEALGWVVRERDGRRSAYRYRFNSDKLSADKIVTLRPDKSDALRPDKSVVECDNPDTLRPDKSVRLTPELELPTRTPAMPAKKNELSSGECAREENPYFLASRGGV